MKQGKKTKKRFETKKKDPRFSKAVMTILRDATVTLEEYMEAAPTRTVDEESGRTKVSYDTLPENVTIVESLYGNYVFKDERLFRHLDAIEMLQKEFGEEFFTEGRPVQEMRHDRKGRTWGDEMAVMGLAYLLVGAGLAEWTSPRDKWVENPNKMPIIKFKNVVTDEGYKYDEQEQSTASGH